MKYYKHLIVVALLSGYLSPAVAADDAMSLDTLLDQVQQGRIDESKDNVAREEAFQRDKANQAALMQKANRERANLEAVSERLEKEFEANQDDIDILKQDLQEALGSLKELFGVLQTAAGDSRATFDSSLTNIEYPHRGDFMTELAEKMGSGSELASLEEIEELWFEIQREMTETGKVKRFRGNVVLPDGQEVEQDIIRVGVFNLVGDGKYLKYDPETQKISELLRQPEDRFVNGAEDLDEAEGGFVPFGLDPTKGQLLGQLVNVPSWYERSTTQGGTVGWIIIGLGIFGITVALLRILYMMGVGMSVAKQVRNLSNPSTNNPLGRVLLAYHENKDIDVESLELKMGEAVLREVPKLSRLNTLIKVISVVAPLLGLLGTVIGMIVTFQSITLFGTGDPKLMAGGISQALITTMLGLCVAIPTVFLHSMMAGQSRKIIETLEGQATGFVAEASEQQHQSA
ncbi:MAG: MotA/TolQ/ExbB proton channel family protein [Gammaproteobacteria bacterium]|nr:MotA/TolQ/ExbB proton channel family protein [Gammaproteobacteria bacterium]